MGCCETHGQWEKQERNKRGRWCGLDKFGVQKSVPHVMINEKQLWCTKFTQISPSSKPSFSAI
jgi:hypothetical protein